ncbi:MAG: hypothetical protein LKE96_00995 [Acetobacter peroxydans]|nr:hypothetical protein [Acetobacter peroxydans]
MLLSPRTGAYTVLPLGAAARGHPDRSGAGKSKEQIQTEGHTAPARAGAVIPDFGEGAVANHGRHNTGPPCKRNHKTPCFAPWPALPGLHRCLRSTPAGRGQDTGLMCQARRRLCSTNSITPSSTAAKV